MKTFVLTYPPLGAGMMAFLLAGCSSSQALPGSTRSGENVAARRGPDVHTLMKPCPTATCIYVVNSAFASAQGSITVYPAVANGNVTPYRTISGRARGLKDPTGIALDAHGQIYVSNYHQYGLTVYAASANGPAKPSRRIRGPKTGLFDTYGVALDSSKQIYALDNFAVVHVFAPRARGDATPLSTLFGRRMRPEDEGIALDGAGNIYVTRNETISGHGKGEVLVYAAGAHGHAAPVWKIYGSKTMLSDEPGDVTVDNAGNVYVADSEADQVDVYAAGEHGDVAPVQAIAGSKTGLTSPTGITVDVSHNIYVTNRSSITVFGVGANGNVAPIQTIAGDRTGIEFPVGIAVH